jgi:transposase
MGSDRLCVLVSDTLQHDPLSDALFLFINRLGPRMQFLYWGGDGLADWYRRLEQGTFQIPVPVDLD